MAKLKNILPQLILGVFLAAVAVVSGYMILSDFNERRESNIVYENLAEEVGLTEGWEETINIKEENNQPIGLAIACNDTAKWIYEKIGSSVPADSFILDPYADPNDYSEYRHKFKKLREINEDFIGWLHISDTSINYPVVYSDDPQKYLTIGFDGKENIAGTLFITGKGLSGQNVVIYGHKMRTGIMFGDLVEFQNKKFANSHKISWATDSGTKSYKVFAVFTTTITGRAFNYTQSIFPTSKDFNEFISKAKNLSVVDTNEHVPDGAKILTLSTCAGGSKRLVVMAYYD